MHRSGASVAACLLASRGLDMGPRATGAGSATGPCSFRDGTTSSFSESILGGMALTRPGGLPPLGWWPGFAATDVPPHVHEDLATAIARRVVRSPGQGWKDCFATLLLDTVDQAAQQPYWVFPYRYPWDVADSLQRSGHPDLLANPRALVPAWDSTSRADTVSAVCSCTPDGWSATRRSLAPSLATGSAAIPYAMATTSGFVLTGCRRSRVMIP